MRRTRLSTKKLKAEEIVEDDDSSNDVARLEYDLKPANTKHENEANNKCELSESSSDTDNETCTRPTKDLNLSSSSFSSNQTPIASCSNFEAIEADIFSGINRLSESDSEIETTQVPINIQNFKDIELYNAKLNDAKKSVENYEAKKRLGTTSLDINTLLAVGERIDDEIQKESSDSENYSDEQEDWEEIKNEKPENLENEAIIKDVEITVEMPGRIAKKKGVDLMASIKRRINRVKKEQQLQIHKVHLLCWVAHGNYVNKVLSQESVQAIALSLLPSQHCYPSSRVDLSYLEQILTWYRKSINYIDQKSNKPCSLEQSLLLQMSRKEASEKNIYVYIFICILRSLGINVRLVMNLLLEPLRPSNSELCSLSNKPTSESKDSEATISEAGNKICKAITSADINDKPVTLASKLSKLPATSSKTKLKSDQNPQSDAIKNLAGSSKNVTTSVPLKWKANSSRQSKTEKSEEQSLSLLREKKKEPISSKNKKDTPPAKTSQTKKSLGAVKKSIEMNSVNKSPKEGKKDTQINKRLSEKSVNNFPPTKNDDEKGRVIKKPSKNLTECETIDLTAKVPKNSELKIKLTNKEVPSINEGKKIDQNELNRQGDSKRNTAKRTSSVTSEKDNRRGGKKRKSTNQVDGPNDSSDESDYKDGININNNYQFTIPQVDGNDSSGSEKKSKPNLRKLSSRSKSRKAESTVVYNKGTNESLKALQKSNEPKKSIFSSSQSSYFSSPDKKGQKKSTDIRPDIINLVKTSIAQEKQKRTSARQRKTKSLTVQEESDSDSDFVSEQKKPCNDYLSSQIKVKRRVLPRKELAKQALNNDDNNGQKQKGIDIWVEVYLEAEEKWISVDVLKGQVHCVKEIYSRASHPVSYILSWDSHSYIKDITPRYCTTNWNTVTRKLRVEPEWWSKTLKAFESPKTAKQREEDEELEQQQMDQPLPKAISEYKNHPLYVLKRHLLKFESIYPADAPALGFIRKEPVYSRMCVHTLHSRDIWLKHAKVVKMEETAYKIVKARPKYDRYSNTFITDQPLEIFGSWQVQDYEPPTAENGIVPKNAYGNVELFKKCMLPKGTVHIDLPGLQKVARKLNIDCPPAVVGFDFHGGWSHPTFEGFVVCEEIADTLTAAWDQEQEEAEKREQEKLDKRVYGNWRKLIKGLLIRERLQKRYDFGKASTSGKKKSKLILKKNRLYSDSDSD